MAYPKVLCECGRSYPPHHRGVNASRINGIANGCTSCKKERHQREMMKAAARCRLRLARHISAARSNRIIYRDVAVRYVAMFHGKTFGVANGISTPELYLENQKGIVLGKVADTYKYESNRPDFTDNPEYADMPF